MQVTTAPLFAAELTPHRSMSPKGLRIVAGLVAVLCLIPTLAFLSVGAWPIVAFMGLDLIAICWALWASFDQGKTREKITVWSEAIEIITLNAKGESTRLEFDPMTVRLVIARDINERTQGLKLKTRDGETEIGSFLTPDEKSSFAKAFGTALRKART